MTTQYMYFKKLVPAALFLIALAVPAHAGGSLWTSQSGPETGMFADRRAHSVGDILTVVVQETSNQNATARTQTEKQSSMNAAIDRFLFSPSASGFGTHRGELPGIDMQGGSAFSGSGEVSNRQVATARVAVMVIDVLPNGNLVIEGAREVTFSRETQYAVLRGIVRREDVTAGNTVLSSNVADATVTFLSKGAMTDGQRKGWFTRFFERINPF